MPLRRIVWFGVSVLALASWFASASTSGVRPPIVPTPPRQPVAIDASVARLDTEVARLHDRLGPTIAPTRSRDLFRFSARAPRPVSPVASAPRPVAVAVADSLAAPPRPALKLIGVAEDVSSDGVVRTAIVAGLGDLFLVKAGDLVAGQFRVEQVSADAVQLTDLTTTAVATLALR
jgi:hypothetical protein